MSPNETGCSSADFESEALLVSRFQSGDESALEEIVTTHKGSLFRFIYRYVNDGSESEDILSQTFVKAWRSRARYRHKAKFQTWLFTIAANLSRDHCRKKKRRPGDFASGLELSDYVEARGADFADTRAGRSPDPGGEAAVSEEAGILRRAIDGLPHDLKTAIVLFSIEGNTQEETARILGCTPKAVETRVYRAKKRLGKQLAWLRED